MLCNSKRYGPFLSSAPRNARSSLYAGAFPARRRIFTGTGRPGQGSWGASGPPGNSHPHASHVRRRSPAVWASRCIRSSLRQGVRYMIRPLTKPSHRIDKAMTGTPKITRWTWNTTWHEPAYQAHGPSASSQRNKFYAHNRLRAGVGEHVHTHECTSHKRMHDKCSAAKATRCNTQQHIAGRAVTTNVLQLQARQP